MTITPSAAPRGLLFLIVGPGGAGKDTLMQAVIDRLHDDAHHALLPVVTATTRPMRQGETDGVSYHFLSRERFRQMIDDDELFEHVEVTSGDYYGTPRASIEPLLAEGRNLILDIDVYGTKALRQFYPQDSVTIFITVPGKDDEERLALLRQRMEKRGDMDPARVEARLQRAKDIELPFAEACDYVIVNDDRQRAEQALYDLVVERMAARLHQTP